MLLGTSLDAKKGPEMQDKVHERHKLLQLLQHPNDKEVSFVQSKISQRPEIRSSVLLLSRRGCLLVPSTDRPLVPWH